MALADSSYCFNGPVDTVGFSLRSAEIVLFADSKNELANFYVARAALWLIEFGGDGIDVKKLSERGLQCARMARKQNEQKPEYIFLTGAHLGFKIQESNTPHLINLRSVNEDFSLAAEKIPGFEQGAPLRALGMLLIKSPSWPVGVGDEEAGLANLEKAAKLYPDFPANRLYLAQGYYLVGRYQDAADQVDQANQLLRIPKWGVPSEVWKKQAVKLQSEIAQKIQAQEKKALENSKPGPDNTSP